MKHFIKKALIKLLFPLLAKKDKLSFLYYLDRFDNSLEPELLHIEDFLKPGNTAIDIGSNLGFYSFRLSKYFYQVHAFEINSCVTCHLQNLNSRKINIIQKGLSSTSGTATLFIPIYRGIAMQGWASLSPHNCPNSESHNKVVVEINKLDDFDFYNVDFIKIDVEGHEVEVLNGAFRTICKNRPTILIEVKNTNREAVSCFFKDLSYQEKKLYDLIGVNGSEENFIYVPL